MFENTRTVEAYMEAYGRLDHEAVLALLTDDVEWYIPGAFHLHGKAAFDAEIENGDFIGHPEIRVTRLIDGGDTVVAEGSVRTTQSSGDSLLLAFCDVFDFAEGKIRKLTSYLMALSG